MESKSAAAWCDEVLLENEAISQDLIEIRFTNPDESTILRKARMNRAEAKKSVSDIKAGAAIMIKQLMHDTDHGAVTLEVPEIQLDVRLTWK